VRTLALIAGLSMALLASAWVAWSYYLQRYPTWTEEVRLLDGRVIEIKQKRLQYENYGTAESWLTFSLPEMQGQQVWHSHLSPQRIDVVNGKVYVFGAPRGVKQFSYYRKPRNYMVAFEWNGQAFARIPFESVPESMRDVENVYPCVPSPDRRPLKLAEKTRQWCPVTGDRWKFGKQINVGDYRQLAIFYAELDNTTPQSD
jgi:hypothetical protein